MLVIGPLGLIILIVIIVSLASSGNKKNRYETDVRAEYAKLSRNMDGNAPISVDEVLQFVNNKTAAHNKKAMMQIVWFVVAMVLMLTGAVMTESGGSDILAGLAILGGLALFLIALVRLLLISFGRPKVAVLVRQAMGD